MINDIKLPKPIETYVRAINAHDAAALQSSFASDAVVQDVVREIRGIAAIKEWPIAKSSPSTSRSMS